MSDNTARIYNFDEAVLTKAAACTKGMICLEQGPSCRIGAILNQDILVVDCLDKNAGCPFYRAQSLVENGESRGLCSCRVRLALWEQFGQ
jgi:hypothetical protein